MRRGRRGTAETDAETALTEALTETPEPEHSPPRRRMRKAWIVGVASLAVVGGAGAYAFNASASAPPTPSPDSKPTTVQVEEGTLSGTRTVPGVLDFAQPRDQGSAFGGVLTGAPAPGSQIDRGGVLFNVDNLGVFLFTGNLPAWRSFESYMSDGPDVKQLEENLKALGYFGYEPDEDFTWNTVEAIYDWQEATGQEETGKIELGRIVFSAAPSVRVADVLASVGDSIGPGAPVLKLSSLVQEVTADLKLADQKLGVLDAKVEVQLPGGVTTTGTITGVGQPTEKENNGQKTVVIPITIALDNTEDAKGIQKANVSVDVPSETRENVLSVPLDALIALPGGGFGVEVVDADGEVSQIPVTTGLFAGGRVEVSGEGIKAGLEVVVPDA